MSEVNYSGGRRDPRTEWLFALVVTAVSEAKDIAEILVDQLVEEVH